MVFGAKQTFLGLDIGTSFIKLAEARRTGKELKITRLDLIPTPAGAVSGGNVIRVEEVASLIRKSVHQHRFRTRRVVTAVPGKNVITRYIKMPAMPAKEVETAIKYEAEKYIPLPIPELMLDYLPVGETEGDGTKQTQYLLIAVPKQVVYQFCEVILQAGLKPVAVEIEPLALLRSYDWMAEGSSGLACVDIGAGASSVSIFKRNSLQFSRTITFGGNNLTESLKQEFDLDFAGAQKLKEHEGEILSAPEGVSEKAARLDTTLREGLGELVHEVRRSLEFFRVQSREGIAKIVLSGGGARLKGLSVLMAEELGVPVELGNPLKNLNTKRLALAQGWKDMAPSLGVVVGLALREVVD